MTHGDRPADEFSEFAVENMHIRTASSSTDHSDQHLLADRYGHLYFEHCK